ncbi:acetyl-CoA carboxylase biotin carboxylase subunit [Candidatus Solincola sp.]|nr:acetyl-CoA carboxylase biotin carboxylase subunit [Actinomycetota bacterium]MDI7253089.1 acetyl-CoA carboxylase biotin carboxylase subunit [Actinomycetota bacterium]
MFKRVLIANRGEIALRILRACRLLGLETVGIYSKADSDAVHLKYVDRKVCVGPAASGESYLNIRNIIGAAEISGADAVHPGYGFLAENEEFARACQENDLVFIGPSPQALALMGHKAKARETMAEAGVPVLPGLTSSDLDESTALKVADELGYPILIKASLGGGGKGMRVVHDRQELVKALPLVKAEARHAFGSEEIYLEKFLRRARHVEIQVLGDRHGKVIHLNERECSIQRRNQKLVEEAPSPAVNSELRKRMGEAAVRGAAAIGYDSAGTMEFLLDEEGNFYFMEFNARIQVEHPVTELITGVDLVVEQIRNAMGEPMSLNQEDIRVNGHAIECRINAEDYHRDFLPTPGIIEKWTPPGGPHVRVDTHCYQGYHVSPNYDSLLAKLIVHGRDREEALRILEQALREFEIEGVSTLIPFHLRLLSNPDFLAGNYHTRWVEQEMF